MKRSFIALFLIFFVGAIYAQMPIILESDLKKLQDEAALKAANAGRDQMRASFRGNSRTSDSQEDSQSQNENQEGADNSQNEAVSGDNNSATTAQATTSTSSSSSARDEYIKRYRDRQKKARNK